MIITSVLPSTIQTLREHGYCATVTNHHDVLGESCLDVNDLTILRCMHPPKDHTVRVIAKQRMEDGGLLVMYASAI